MKFPTPAEMPGSGSFRQTDWFRLIWRQQRLIAWERRALDHGAVVFVGDSIIQNWANLEATFPGVKVANRGLAGDTSRGVLYRLRGDVLELAPPMVVLLCGINDLGDGDSPDAVLQNLREVVAICQTNSARPRLILCNILPVGKTNPVVNARVRELNQKLSQLADAQEGVVIADVWSALADQTGSANRQDFPDLLHPNAAGYDKLARAIRPLLLTKRETPVP